MNLLDVFFILFSFVWLIFIGYVIFINLQYKFINKSFYLIPNDRKVLDKFINLFYHPLVFVKPNVLNGNCFVRFVLDTLTLRNDINKEEFHSFLKDFFYKYRTEYFSLGDCYEPDVFFKYDIVDTYTFFFEYFILHSEYTFFHKSKIKDKHCINVVKTFYESIHKEIPKMFQKYQHLGKNNKYIIDLFSNDFVKQFFIKRDIETFKQLTENSPLAIQNKLDNF